MYWQEQQRSQEEGWVLIVVYLSRLFTPGMWNERLAEAVEEATSCYPGYEIIVHELAS